MPATHLLTSPKARICRVAGGFFLAAALCLAAVICLAPAAPELLALCNGPHCEVTEGPIDVLPREIQTQVRSSPDALARFEAYRRRPLVRVGALGVAAVSLVPFAGLLFGVGLALRRLGGGGDALGQALPWLRRASLAAIVWALSSPLAESLEVMLLYPGTPAGAHWHIVLDPKSIMTGLMLAVAAYAAVWAMEAGVQAQRDLAEIV
ncbi:hypothetical protein [Sphingomonas guangdongensis]|uniref:hypothetical protein n=1 Tax=Sphingomonas guangdongensis TaxID=1141890 RepID=UPI000BE2A137|nr:hypothetical protein [Sphingomonas guangdongensis]